MGTEGTGKSTASGKRVEVLRLGHRPDRDKRITTHVALVSRAFGATAINVDTSDRKLKDTIDTIGQQFGGKFNIETGVSPKSIIHGFGGTIVHLTMYGERIQDVIDDIPREEDLLLIIGSEKVPRDIYDLAHFNVSISNQPHSEVSALAIFLDRYFEGKQLDMDFSGGEISILPDGRGKSVVRSDELEGSTRPSHLSDGQWSEVPSEDECMEILNAAGCSSIVIKHSRAVHELGMEMVARSGKEEVRNGSVLDLDKLSAGLLLHDLGRSRTHSIRHCVIGAELAEEMGLHPDIVSMIRVHVGGGLPAVEAAGLGLPTMDLIPSTVEEKIVSHADTLVGNLRRRTIQKAMERLRERGAEIGAKRVEALHREIEKYLAIDLDTLVDV